VRTYRVGADGSGVELGQRVHLGLRLTASRELGLALEHGVRNAGNALADGVVGLALKVAAGLDGLLVGLEGLLDCIGLARGSLGDGGDLGALLGREREPVLLLRLELRLVGEGHGRVEEGGRCGDDHTVGAEGVDGLLGERDRLLKVVLPDVAAGDDTEGEADLGRLDGLDGSVELLRRAGQVDVEELDRKVLDEVDVAVQTAEVGGDGDVEANLGELAVGLLVLGREAGGGVHDKGRLVELDRGGAGLLKGLEELDVDGDKLLEEGDRLEVGIGGRAIGRGLADEEVGDGTGQDRSGLKAGLLGLLEELDVLVGACLGHAELGRRGKLGDLPRGFDMGSSLGFGLRCSGSSSRTILAMRVRTRQQWSERLTLHLHGGQIDAIALPSPAHGKGQVEVVQLGLLVFRGHNAERDRQVENVVICRCFQKNSIRCALARTEGEVSPVKASAGLQ
jgi:hypothetical protein